MALSHNTKTKLRRTLIYLKYLLPGFICLLVWLFSALKIWRFSNGDGTERVYQSLIGLVKTIKESSATTLAATESSSADMALATSLRYVWWIFWGVLLFATLFAFILTVFSIIALPKDPLSNSCNRAKVWFRMFFPGRVSHMLLPIVTAIPLLTPYYVVDRFTKYYGASGATEGEIGTTFSYYDYSVTAAGINPLIIVSVFVIAAVLAYVWAIPYERSQKLDMYTNFEENS